MSKTISGPDVSRASHNHVSKAAKLLAKSLGSQKGIVAVGYTMKDGEYALKVDVAEEGMREKVPLAASGFPVIVHTRKAAYFHGL